jgi:hypothetical protein
MTLDVSILITVNRRCPKEVFYLRSFRLFLLIICFLYLLSFLIRFLLLLTIYNDIHNPPWTCACLNLQIVFDAVNQGLHDIKLKLNAPKTVFMIFTKRRTLNYRKVTLVVNGNQIHPSEPATFLGLIIDPQSKWSSYIKAKCACKYVVQQRELFVVIKS